MLGKLIKYELKSTSRLFGVIYLVILVLSLLIGISGRSFFQETVVVSVAGEAYDMSLARGVPFIIMVIAYSLLVFALVIITFVAILERFYKNMLLGEGYLMHTLPVPTWMLVAGKTISAFIWEIMGSAVVILSLIVISVSGGIWKTIVDRISDLLSNEYYLEWKFMCFIWVTAVLIGSIRLILTFYVSMAIGGAAKKHKKRLSVLAFICIVIAIQIISLIFGLGSLETWFTAETGNLMWEIFHVSLVKAIISDIVLSAVFFGVTTFFLQKKLNLE